MARQPGALVDNHLKLKAISFALDITDIPCEPPIDRACLFLAVDNIISSKLDGAIELAMMADRRFTTGMVNAKAHVCLISVCRESGTGGLSPAGTRGLESRLSNAEAPFIRRSECYQTGSTINEVMTTPNRVSAWCRYVMFDQLEMLRSCRDDSSSSIRLTSSDCKAVVGGCGKESRRHKQSLRSAALASLGNVTPALSCRSICSVVRSRIPGAVSSSLTNDAVIVYKAIRSLGIVNNVRPNSPY